MNKIYKIIWSDVRKCYVVVAEIARNRGKNNVRTIVEGLAAHSLARAGRWALPFVTAGALLLHVQGWAATQITPASVLPADQKNTVENSNGVYTVYMQRKIPNGPGVNQFDKFSLENGNIANMHFRTKNGGLTADSLVNLVKDRIDIQGTVNAVKNNRIDGNLYFISPNGMTLGPNGVINAGRFVAMAPSSDYFDSLWSTSFTKNAAGDFDQNVADAVKNDFAKFGTRYKKNEQEGKEEGEFKSTNLEFNSDSAADKGIVISGRINTRSGIVLGAGNIAIENGAVLKSQKDINFSNLVNTENVSGAAFSNIGMTAVTDDKSGDIILRAEAKHEFVNSPLIPGEQTYDSITNVNNHAAVTVKGEIEGDAGVDISAESKTTFNNKDWPGISGLSDTVPEFLNDLGITWAADWAHKVNSAAVTLDSTGKVTAGGNAGLQADSTLSIKIQAKTVGKRDAGASTAIPVTAVAVVNASNKALVDVKGELAAEGDISLAATADTTLDVTAKATTEKPDGDTGNAIYLGGALLFGDSVAETNVESLTKNNQPQKLTAGGVFSAEATANSEIAVEAASAGLNESFASTALAWLDYDSAANVNLKRSVEAESVTAKAANQVDSLGISADNSIGEGVDPMIEFKVAGESNVSALANKIKTKMGAEGFRQGGKLQGVENVFNNALQYVTAGAAVAVVDNTNTANVIVTPGVELKAVKKDEDGNPTNGGGDVTVEAVTNMKSFSHTVTGQMNKQTDNAAQNSKVNVAAAFLYSNIDNNATVELQSDNNSNTSEGVTLTSVSGNVTLKADVESDDSNSMSTLRGSNITEAWDNLINALKAMKKDTSKLTQWKKETVDVQTELADGTISKAEAATRWTNALGGFGSFVSSEINDILKVDNNLKKMVTALSDYLSPSSYTNYYVRSYTLNGNQSGDTATVAASVNYANLENKGIVTIGESSALTAGKDISIRSKAQTESISATGNSGEYLAYSETNGTGIGASLAWQDISADAMVLAGKNVTMQARPADGSAAGKIDISTNAEVEDVSIIFSAGKADRSGLAGSFNIQDGGSNSLILVDDEATLSATDAVSLAANNKLVAFNLAGGLALGSAKSTATVGAGLAMNRQDANSMTVIGDNGTNASTTITDTESEEYENKSVEEKNNIKKENTLAAARKLAADRGTIRSMDRNFADAKTAANRQLGAATASGADKGSVTGTSITASSVNSGTINALAVEGVSNSENHAGLDTVNQWNKTVTQAKSDITDTVQNVIGWPVARWANKTFTGETKKSWNFRKYEPIPENNAAATNKFNIAAAGSVSLNLNNSQTAAVIDRVNLTLSDGGAGKLKNEATDDIFTGAWAGAAAMNWFTGGAGVASNNAAHKGTLGAAVALNKLDRNVKAVISNAAISRAKLIENTAIKKGTEAAASLGIAVTNNGQGTGTNAGIAFGLAMNKVDSGVHALLIDNTSAFTNSNNTSGSTGVTDISNRAYDGDIQVAGGVDFAFANSADGGRAIAAGITAAVSEIKNDIQSGIQGGTYTGVNNMSVAGDDALTQVNAAVGLGFTTSEHGFDGAASFAYAELENTNHAYISGTEEIKATGEVSVTGRDISGSGESNPYVKYLKDRKVDAIGSSYLSSDTKRKLGTEAGSSIVNVAVEINGSKSVGLGAAVAAANVTNKFGSDITDNKKLEADSVRAAADVHTNIVSVGAGVSVSTQSFGGTGSLSFIDLDQDNIVSITGNRNGTEAASGIKANAVSGTANNTSHIVNVTGDFAGGKNAVGLGVAYNYMDNTTGVYAGDNQIKAKDAEKGVAVSLDAENDAYALALSAGAAVTYKDNGIVAAHGNFGVNRGYNDTVAVIGEDKAYKSYEDYKKEKEGQNYEKDKITNASSVTVKATDNTSKTSIAGDVDLALKNNTVALGVGVALTDIGTGSGDSAKREVVRAEINNTDIITVQAKDANGNAKDPVISAAATDTSRATTVAAGIGIARDTKVGAQIILADAEISKKTTAGLNDTTVKELSGSDAGRKARVNVKADTSSTLKTGAGALQVSGSNTFLTGVIAVGINRIRDDTTAGVTFAAAGAGNNLDVANLDINATAKGDILSVAAGAAGGWKNTAIAGGSGSYNYIANNAKAVIQNANVDSTGNVGVVAQSDEAISNYAGVLDVAIGGQGVSAAVGVTGSNNQITGKTEALIENSTVNAAGSSGGDDDDKVIRTKSKLKDNTENEKYMIEGSVNRGIWSSGSFTEGEGDNKTYGVSRLQKGREEETKTGVVVDASATHSVSSAMANGGVAVGSGQEALSGSLAGVVNLNYVSGATIAQVLDSNLNNANRRSDVNVRAADYTNVAEFSGSASVAVGQQLAGAAGFTGTTNEIDRVTSAGVSTKPAEGQQNITATDKTKNNIYAKNFNVTADAKQAMSAFNVTGAVAGSSAAAFETGDNVNTNKMHSSTIATVTNSTVDYTQNARIKASHEDAIYNMNVDAGLTISTSGEGMAGSLNVGIGVVNEDSVALADIENSKLKVHDRAEGDTTKSDLSIGAANNTKLEATLVSVGVAAGLFSGGVASSIAVNNIDTNVTSRILGSELTADTINVDTTNELKVKDATGTGGGALMAGIGVGVDVNTFNDSVSTIVDHTGEGNTENKSTLKANDTLSVNTKTQRDIDATVAGVGIGGAGISVNVLAVTVNDGINQLGYAQDADGNDTDFSHTYVVDTVLGTVNDNTKRILADHFYGLTAAEQAEMQRRVNTSARTGNDENGDHINGTGVHSYVRNNSTLEATNGALTVKNTELNDAQLNGGSGSLGAAAVNVADVVYHLNELNDIEVTDSTVKGGSVSLTAHQGNVTKNKDDAIHLKTVQAGLGGWAIGAGYAGLTTKGETGITVDRGVLTATKGDLTVKSSDDVKSKTDMVGVSAGVLSVPVSVAHNYNAANNFVTVWGGSTLTAATDETREVTDSNGNKTAEKVPASVSLLTERTGRVAAKTVGVGVGGTAVIVNTAKVRDTGKAGVTVEDSGNTFTADAIRMGSTNAPVLKAEAGGTGVSVLGVAVMHSSATAKSQATVSVEDGNSFLADTVLAQAVIGREGTDMTHAETHSTNVSVGSIAPNKAKAITETTASVTMGSENYKTEKKEKTTNEQGQEEEKTVTGSYTSLALITQNNASRRAIIGNMSIGIGASIGTGDAKTEGNDKSLVEAKGGAGSNEAAKLKNLKISAGGNNTAKGFADGDSGGITAWGAAATITMNTKTTNTASLSGAWDVAENADIGSLQQVTSKGTSKTGAGGVLSVTWANSDNNVEMDTRTQLMEGTRLNAGQSYMLAANKVVTGAYDGESWNNHMNVGGVIQIAPDIKSRQEIKTNANVEIGKAAGGNSGSGDPATKVTTSKGQVYDAYSDMDVCNKVEGKGGGVAENIYTYSDNFVTSTNKITVNDKAELEQKGEYENGNDITLSSSDRIKMNLAAEAYAGGLEGTVKGQVETEVTRNNSVEVNGKLSSTHDTNIYAGVNADGTKSSLNVTALAEAHNNSVLPPYTSPEILLGLKNNQQVKIGSTGSATSVRNINVSAENGSETIKKDTVAVYWLFVGQSKDSKTATNTQGVSTVSENNNNFVNVDGVLKTGIQNNVKIDIKGALLPKAKDSTGAEYTPMPKDSSVQAYTDADVYVNGVKIARGTATDTIIRPEDIITGEMDYATQLGSQLATLEKLISDYGTDQDRDDKKTAAYLGYVQQRQRILEEMEKRGLFKDEKVPKYQKNADGSYKTDSAGNLIPVTDAGGNIVYEMDAQGKEIVRRVYTTKGLVISYVEIPDITVSGGNIVVQSDTLYGNGSLEANGAPRIEINNLSNAYLKLNNITVGEEGGDIRFRGESLSTGETGRQQIRNLNKDTGKTVGLTLYSDAGNESVITVLNDNSSTGTTITVTGNNQEWAYTSIPDVAVLGNINNSYGLVKIENKQGNITLGSGDAEKNKANVNGRSVQLIATHGSISQDYIDGIVNIGGRPQDLNRSIADSERARAGLNKEQDNHKYNVINATPVQSDSSAGRIAGDNVYLAAADINVNGLIQSGYGKYVAEIAEDALSDANIEKLKNNGSEVTIQGRTMYKLNDGNKAVYDSGTGAYKYIIQVYYDPGTKGLVVEDIDTRGGKIYLTGRISSTGNGRILAVDGGAEISITNNTKADLSAGKILNNDIEGKISITDLAKSTWTEYDRNGTNSMSIAAYEKYLTLTDAYKADFAKLNDTQKVSYLNLSDIQRAEYANPQTTDARRAEILGTPTEAQINEAKIVSGGSIGHNNGATPSASYAVKDDLRYNWTEGEDTSITRYYRLETSSLFWGGLKYGDNTSELAKLESSLPSTTRPGTESELGKGDFIGAIDNKYGLNNNEFGAIFENNLTDNSRTVTGSGKESGDWWALWSNPTYWVTWTTKTGSTQSYTYSLKANKQIGVGFIGQKDGSISVTNTNTVSGNVNLDGNIQNNTKDATLTVQSAGGSIIQKSGTSLTTGHADLRAKNDIENIHITSLGERIAATTQNEGGDVAATYIPHDGVKLSAVSYNGGDIDVDVVGGTADGQKLPGNVVITRLASKGRQHATEKPGDVSLKAEGNITQFISLGQKFTDENGAAYISAEAYLQNDAAYQALPDNRKQAYADKVTQEFEQLVRLRQKFTKTGSAGTYDSAAEYLAQDNTYQAKLQANSAYANQIKNEYANKDGHTDLEQKYRGYNSAEEYLDQDKAYQDLLFASAAYRDNVEDEFARFTKEETASVQGRSIRLTSVKGSIGTVEEIKNSEGTVQRVVPKRAVVIDSFAEAYGLSEDTANVSAEAKKHIYLAEKEGDMRVGSIISHEGDVRVEATDGRLVDALPQQDNANNVDEDDLIHHWIDAGLIAGTEDYEGAYIKGLKQDAANYKARVEEQYREFKNGGQEQSLRQKFTKPGSAETYSSAAEYLEQDKAYMVMENSNADYKAHIQYEYEHRADNPDWQAKYANYDSAGDYLDQDTAYKNMLASSKNYKDTIEKEFKQFTVEDGIKSKFTKEDGTFYTSASEYLNYDTGEEAANYRQLVKDTQNETNEYVRLINQEFTAYKNGTASAEIEQKYAGYDSVSQYLLADNSPGGYLEMIAEQNETEVRICEEFAHFSNNKSKGHLTDMFTMPGGKTYDSAAAYLRDDATYNAMVQKYEHPEYAWTKEQLLYAIRNAIVNKESGVNAESQSKAANIQGKNVTLVSRGVGVNTNQTTEISVSELGGGSEASIAKMKLLSNADAADVTMKNKNGDILRLVTETKNGVLVNTWKAYKADNPSQEIQYGDASDYAIDKFVIGNMSPLGVYADGKLDVTAIDNNAFVAGRSNDQAGFAPLNVGQITAVGNDVRLYTREGIYNAADTATGANQGNIHAKDVIAYGGTKDIGTKDKQLTLSLSGDLLEAYADGSVYIKNTKAEDRLRVGSVYAKDTVSLESAKGFDMTANPDYTIAYLNAGKVLELKTSETEGEIGTETNPIRILNNAGTPENFAGSAANNGMLINLEGRDAYVKGVNGTRGENTTMRLGLIEMAGNFAATSESYMEAGAVRLAEGEEGAESYKPGINGRITAAGNVKLDAAKDVTVNGPVNTAAGTIKVKSGENVTVNKAENDEDTLNADGADNMNGGQIEIEAADTATINGSVAAMNAILVSGGQGVTLNDKVSAGSLNFDAGTGEYTGNGLINLVSAEGLITQNEGGILTARRVTATSGKAITLTSEGNTFREFMAEGVEKEITDQGQTTKEKAIDGSVDVRAHAGKTLSAGIDSTNVYGNVTLQNLDGFLGKDPDDNDLGYGGLTVTTDIVAKHGNNGEAGSITFQQQGDILVKGALQADGYVTEEGYLETEQGIVGSGSIINEKSIQAGQDVTLRTTSGDIHTMETVTAAGDVTAASTASADGKIQISGDVFAENINIASLGATVITEKYMDAGQNITVETHSGDINLNGVAHAGKDFEISSGKNHSESGNISVKGSLSAMGNLNVQTDYTGDDPGQGNIILGTLSENVDQLIYAGDNVNLKTTNGNITVNTILSAGNDLQAATDSGDIIMQNNVTAQNDIIATSASGNIRVENGDIEAKRNITAQTGGEGNIHLNIMSGMTNRHVTAGNGISLTSDEGSIWVGGDVTAENGDVIAVQNNGKKATGENGEEILNEGILFSGDVSALNGNVKANVVKNGMILYLGKVEAPKGNIEAIIAPTGSGFIQYGDDYGNGMVNAGGNVTAEAGSGDIIYASHVKAGENITALAHNGDIKGSGNMNAGMDVALGSTEGDVDLSADVTATHDVTLWALQGNVEVKGNIESTNGDTLLKATNNDPHKSDGNIKVLGTVTSGDEIILNAENGDISVTGDVISGNDVYAEILNDADGNISLGGNITAANEIVARTAGGDITLGSVSEYGSITDKVIDAGLNISVESESGNIQLLGNVEAGRQISAVTGGDGTLSIGSVDTAGDVAEADVLAGESVYLKTENGDMKVLGKLEAKRNNVNLLSESGNIYAMGDIDAGVDIIATNTDGKIEMDGDIDANHDVKVTNTSGKIEMDGDIYAGNDLTVSNQSGAIEITGDNAESDIIFANNNINVTNTSGDIKMSGIIYAGQNINAANTGGVIEMTGAIVAGNDVNAANGSGNVVFNGDVDASQNIIVNTETGNITANGDVTAVHNDIRATSASGNIELIGDIDAGHDVVANTGGNGLIHLNGYLDDNEKPVWSGDQEKYNVHAGNNVSLTTENTGILVTGQVRTDKGDVLAATDTGAIVFSGDVNAGRDVQANVTQGGIIMYGGTTVAGRDITAATPTGGILYSESVVALGNVTARTDEGPVIYNASVLAGDSVLAAVQKGDISVKDAIYAQAGSVTLTTENGSVTVGNDEGSGQISAHGDVTINAKQTAPANTDLVDIKTSVESRNANVNVKTVNGNIHIGSSDADTETVTAKNNVNLEAVDGKIIIDGKTSTLEGDITLQASNTGYVAGDNGKNIIINHNGVVESARNANLIAVNGDLHVTDNVTAKGTLNAETRGQGDISLDQNVNVVKDMTMQAEKGDITVGRDITAKNGNVTVNALSGSVAVGASDGNGNKSGKIEAGGDVTINAAQPAAGSNNLVDIVTSVESKGADVNIKTENGNIHIGNNDADTKTVTAKNNVNLEAVEGKIIIDGKTSTRDGDVTLKAANKEYVAGEDGQNIIINQSGVIESGGDANLITINGDLLVTDNVKARGSLNSETQGQGNISLAQNVNVENDMSIRTENGDITIGKQVNAGQGSVTLTTETGNVTIGEDITAGNSVSVTTGTGDVTVGSNGSGSVTADKDVAVNVGKGSVDIVKSVASNNGSVAVQSGEGNIHIGNNGPDVDTVKARKNVTLETADGKITVDGKTSTRDGDVTLKAANKEYVAGKDGQNIIINHTGKVESGHDANLIAGNGDLHVTDRVTAQGVLNAETHKQGDISLDDDVNIVKDISMKTENGNITIGRQITADNGSIAMTTGTGNVSVGEDVTAGKNVNILVGKGNISVEETVTAKTGSVGITTQKGNIHIGDNGPDVKTVTAKHNVNLETENGKVEIYGKTSTAAGDITIKAANSRYAAGEGGQNIIIDHNGQIASGRDVTLVANNGDLHVTDAVKAQRDVNAITQQQGDVFLDDDLTVNGNVTMKTDTGNIDADRNVTAGNRIEAMTGNGDITVGTADARYVALTSGSENGHLKAKMIRTEANGNSNGTGLEDIKLGGSYVNVNTVVNKNNGSTPLTISTLGSAANKPVKDFSIGARNAGGSYTGGIQSASGAVMQQLWAEKGMIYMKGDTNLHVSKVVVNEKFHVANDNISVAVFGVPPTRDGERVVYWNDAEKKAPTGRLNRWFDRSYSDPAWMYLDLFGNGELGSRYGVLIDTNGYRKIYGDSVSVVDTMRLRLEPVPEAANIAYFNRSNLIEISDDNWGSNAGEDEITAE